MDGIATSLGRWWVMDDGLSRWPPDFAGGLPRTPVSWGFKSCRPAHAQIPRVIGDTLNTPLACTLSGRKLASLRERRGIEGAS